MKRATLLLLLAALPACWREKRDLREVPAAAERMAPVRVSTLQPGARLPEQQVKGPYEGNAAGISEGQRLYQWFNCVGCHANGGGGMGPALMDGAWVYGSEPQQVYQTIAQGRPNGMPSFGGHATEQQIWQLVAYVRSLSQLQPPDAVAPRQDGMSRNSTAQPR